MKTSKYNDMESEKIKWLETVSKEQSKIDIMQYAIDNCNDGVERLLLKKDLDRLKDLQHIENIKALERTGPAAEPEPEPSQYEAVDIIEFVNKTNYKDFTDIYAKLLETKLLSVNKGEFAAISLIIFNTGWINKKNCADFQKWLDLFSRHCKREKPKFDINKLSKLVAKIKDENLFLEKLPIKPIQK